MKASEYASTVEVYYSRNHPTRNGFRLNRGIQMG